MSTPGCDKMIEIARTDDGLTFCILEYSSELDKLRIGDFEYFKKHLGMADYTANFRSWLKRPSVFLMLIIFHGKIVGWTMNEKWNKPSADGRPVFVLRAIEISPGLSRKGHGKDLFVMVSRFLPGHMITKPVNASARAFFESLGFILPDIHSPVNLNDHPGYLILSEERKPSLKSIIMDRFNANILSARQKKFPKELIVENPGEQQDGSADMEGSPDDGVTQERADSEAEDSSEDNDSQAAEDLPVQDRIVNDTEGEFKGDQKMMTPCKCGAYSAGKFLQEGSRCGTAFVCLQCGTERYFLPLKK